MEDDAALAQILAANDELTLVVNAYKLRVVGSECNGERARSKSEEVMSETGRASYVHLVLVEKSWSHFRRCPVCDLLFSWSSSSFEPRRGKELPPHRSVSAGLSAASQKSWFPACFWILFTGLHLSSGQCLQLRSWPGLEWTWWGPHWFLFLLYCFLTLTNVLHNVTMWCV